MKLQIENIDYKIGESHFNYNLKVDSSIIGIYGESGSGKTTLIKLMSGLETPNNGKIKYNDTVIFDKENKINMPVHKRKIGIVFQEHYLFPHLTIKNNLLYNRSIKKSTKSSLESFDSIISMLDIKDLIMRKPHQLSGGERQRVAIGRMLLSKPNLILLDEPFSNLDKNKRSQIISYLLKINYMLTIPLIIISHDLEDILKLTHTIVVIKKRTVLSAGNYLDLIYNKKIPDCLSEKQYINIIELYYDSYTSSDKLHKFTLQPNSYYNSLKICSRKNEKYYKKNQKVRFFIKPEQISISNTKLTNTSAQNQIQGIVQSIYQIKSSYFIIIDCGFRLVAEITFSAFNNLKIKENQKVFCIIKAKAIDLIHVYN